ncbi:DUF5330 domain-containing protein [Bartonella apihabitans]|uniref:DUF5330 domain-containing protein n=1 Tax=Bartonella apihabitans TaxID=2750929 RepID=UPI003997F5B5
MIRFLIKSFCFLTLFLVVISFFGTSGKNNGSQPDQYMNTVEALLAVKDTVNDLGNFCERNSDTCETGKTFFGSLGERARDGARIAYEYLDRTFGSDKGENKLPPENINTGSITPENDHEDHYNKVDNKKVDNKNGSTKSLTSSNTGHKQPAEPEEKKMHPSQKPQ